MAHKNGQRNGWGSGVRSGKMMKKEKNTFTDFIDAAKFLIQEKFKQREHLYAQRGD